MYYRPIHLKLEQLNTVPSVRNTEQNPLKLTILPISEIVLIQSFLLQYVVLKGYSLAINLNTILHYHR